VREPVSGYASKKDAIMAMLAEGLSDDEIVFRAKTTAGSVAAYRSQRNARSTMSREKAAKAHRIVEKAIQVMADGIGCSPAQLHQFIKRNYFGFDRAVPEPALPPEQKVDEAEPARAGLVDAHMQHSEPEIPSFALSDDECLPVTPTSPPKPEPKPMMVMKLDKRPMDLTNASRFYTLRREGMYLNLDGSGFTDVRRHAYRATLPQARKMRLVNAVAMGCSLSPFELSKK
jgi:hypothetical protein